LIAAAPDLLAALKSVRWQYPTNSEAHEIAAAAIAKAEGNA
jgi:histidinol-phosphate/aromatic aminotransferase/cobyric acid decarboxylase-like protein